MFVRILCVKIFTQGLFSSLVESSELFSNIYDRVPSNVSLDTKMKDRYVQYHLLFKVKLLHLKALSLCCVKIFTHKIFIVLSLSYEIMKICIKKLSTLSTGIPSTENYLFCPKLEQCGCCREDSST